MHTSEPQVAQQRFTLTGDFLGIHVLLSFANMNYKLVTVKKVVYQFFLDHNFGFFVLIKSLKQARNEK